MFANVGEMMPPCGVPASLKWETGFDFRCSQRGQPFLKHHRIRGMCWRIQS
jgi:hypothetical protein